MSDVNEVFLAGELAEATSKRYPSQQGSFMSIKLKVGTLHNGSYYVDIGGGTDGLAHKLDALNQAPDPICVLLWPGYLDSSHSKGKYYWKLACRAANLILLPASITSPPSIAPCAYFVGKVVQCESDAPLLVAAEYSYYSKKEKQQVSKERLFYVVPPDNIVRAELYGKHIAGNGVLNPRLGGQWLTHVQATELVICQ